MSLVVPSFKMLFLTASFPANARNNFSDSFDTRNELECSFYIKFIWNLEEKHVIAFFLNEKEKKRWEKVYHAITGEFQAASLFNLNTKFMANH